MSTPPTSHPPLPIRVARAIRHLPGLRKLEPVWNLLRKPYHRLLELTSRKHGVPLNIEGVGVVRVPPSFMTNDVDALEIPMLQRMVTMIPPDSCFYDIGASIGLHSMVAGEQLGAGGEIHAFEPDLASCALYWSHLALVRRRLPVRLSKTFVSDQSTVSEPLGLFPEALKNLSDQSARQQSRHLYLFKAKQGDESGTSIPCISIDAYVAAGANPPSVIKCDIEGAELLFLRGAATTLRVHKPTLFVSVHPKLVGEFGYREQEVFDFLESLNYSWTLLNSVGETHVFATAAGIPAR